MAFEFRPDSQQPVPDMEPPKERIGKFSLFFISSFGLLLVALAPNVPLGAIAMFLFGGEINGTVIAVDALGSVILTTGGGANWISFLNSTSQTVTAATALGAALGNNTRYYLYAYNNAGTLDFIANTNVPNASRTYENGNTDHVFITTFVTDGSGIIIPYVQNRGRVVYTTPGANPSISMNTGGAAWTDANPNATTPMVPSWAQTVDLYLVLTNSDNTAGGDVFSLRAKSITGTGYTGAGKVHGGSRGPLRTGAV